jgi:AraC family transcriptional regulator, regulatory protein of adaptative response / methylated-DNA-[protein]-cysteine methyltransferase
MTARTFNTARRWQAVCNRDKTADGAFFYAVRTTGVYCRPSCGARRPLRENVTFHASAAQAEAAGYRPCKRCRPNDLAAELQRIANACRLIESSDVAPSLQQLAAAADLSPFHFHRLFKRATGLTPREYGAAHRQRVLRKELQRDASVTSAIVAAGYGSSSRFYERAAQLLGMHARDYRDGGRDARIRFALGETSLGSILVAATARGVCLIEFGDDPQALLNGLQQRFTQAELVGADAAFEQLVANIVAQVERPQTDFLLPLDVRGTAFQHRVWQALQQIPLGETATYTQIAGAVGKPAAVRAVAQACAANQVALAIPCHRVIRLDASLSGYRWGVERKRELLARERGQVLRAESPRSA